MVVELSEVSLINLGAYVEADMEYEKRRFLARSSSGEQVEIIELATKRREFTMRDGHYSVENGLARLVTSDGVSVSSAESEGEYLVGNRRLLVREVR
jgi:hypothetical protein